MVRRNDSILDVLAELPWQVSVVFSLCAFIGFRYVLPALSNDTPITIVFSKFAWLLALVLLLPGIVSYLNASRKKKLLDSQQSLASIRALSWKEFEELLAEAFRRKGYLVTENTKLGPDGGVDIYLQRDGRKSLVQCKNWKKYKVDVKVVREMVGIMTAEAADEVIVVTSGSFTQPARDFAKSLPVELIDGGVLLDMVTGVQPLDVQIAAANFGALAVPEDDIRVNATVMNSSGSSNLVRKILLSAVIPAVLIIGAIFALPKFMQVTVEKTLFNPAAKNQVKQQEQQQAASIAARQKENEKRRAEEVKAQQLLIAKKAEQDAKDEEQRLEQAFSDSYQAPAGCDSWSSNDHMVECVNHQMRAKKQFKIDQLNKKNKQ